MIYTYMVMVYSHWIHVLNNFLFPRLKSSILSFMCYNIHVPLCILWKKFSTTVTNILRLPQHKLISFLFHTNNIMMLLEGNTWMIIFFEWLLSNKYEWIFINWFVSQLFYFILFKVIYFWSYLSYMVQTGWHQHTKYKSREVWLIYIHFFARILDIWLCMRCNWLS